MTMSHDPNNPPTKPTGPEHEHINTDGEPVAVPLPPMDGTKPVPPGSDQVERFNVATDTEGGD